MVYSFMHACFDVNEAVHLLSPEFLVLSVLRVSPLTRTVLSFGNLPLFGHAPKLVVATCSATGTLYLATVRPEL